MVFLQYMPTENAVPPTVQYCVQQHNIHGIWGSQSSTVEDSSLLGCDRALGKWFPTFPKNVLPSSSKAKTSKKIRVLHSALWVSWGDAFGRVVDTALCASLSPLFLSYLFPFHCSETISSPVAHGSVTSPSFPVQLLPFLGPHLLSHTSLLAYQLFHPPSNHQTWPTYPCNITWCHNLLGPLDPWR